MRQVEEQFQTYSETGEPLALVDRSIAHQRGDWHRAVQVFLFRSDRQLLIQQRAQSKDVCPGLWDLSVAEHLQPSESYLDAAHRGLAEELGVRNLRLEPIGDEFRVRLEIEESGVFDRELQRCFVGNTDQQIEFNPNEVAAIAYYNLVQLHDAFAQSPNKFTPWFIDCATRIDLFSTHFTKLLFHERREFLR